MSTWDVTITVSVEGGAQLWRDARDRYFLEVHGGTGADMLKMLGTAKAPNIRNCLIMLLDRSDHLGDGGSIECSEAEEIAPDDDEESDYDPVREHGTLYARNGSVVG